MNHRFTLVLSAGLLLAFSAGAMKTKQSLKDAENPLLVRAKKLSRLRLHEISSKQKETSVVASQTTLPHRDEVTALAKEIHKLRVNTMGELNRVEEELEEKFKALNESYDTRLKALGDEGKPWARHQRELMDYDRSYWFMRYAPTRKSPLYSDERWAHANASLNTIMSIERAWRPEDVSETFAAWYKQNKGKLEQMRTDYVQAGNKLHREYSETDKNILSSFKENQSGIYRQATKVFLEMGREAGVDVKPGGGYEDKLIRLEHTLFRILDDELNDIRADSPMDLRKLGQLGSDLEDGIAAIEFDPKSTRNQEYLTKTVEALQSLKLNKGTLRKLKQLFPTYLGVEEDFKQAIKDFNETAFRAFPIVHDGFSPTVYYR